MAPLFTAISPAMGNISGLVVILPCVPAVYPHCKLLWQYQPLIVRASPGWPLSCSCSSELLLPDPQSSELPLGSSCAKHVYTCGRHTNGEETYVSSEMIRTFSPWYCRKSMWSTSSWLDVRSVCIRVYPSQSLLEHNISDHTHILIGCLTSELSFSHLDHFLIIQHFTKYHDSHHRLW